MTGNARTIVVACVALLAVVAAPTAGAWGTGTQAVESPGNATTNVGSAPTFVTVQTAVDPAQPTPGEPFEVVATLANGEDSDVGYSVPEVAIQAGRDENSEVYATVENLDLLDPGERLSVSPSVELNETGMHTLYVHAELVGPDGETSTVVAPVRVRVYRPTPLIEADAARADAGEGRTLEVTVANGDTDPIREVALRLSGEDVTFDQQRRVAARIAAGGSRTLTFDAESESLGRKSLTATLSYTTADGTRRTTTERVTPTFEAAPDEDSGDDDTDVTGSVQVAADAGTALPGSDAPLNVTVVNGLSVPVRQYEVTVESEGLTVQQPRRIGGRLATSERRQLRFTVRADSPGTYTVAATVRYTTTNGTERSVTRDIPVTITAPANPGNVTLTGLDFSRGPNGLQISGTAANRGGTAVEGVVVGVADGESVGPAATQSEYFVGTVESSDFVSFDVNARIEGNASTVTVPLRVEYVVDGVTRERTVTVTYSPGAAGPPAGAMGPGASGPGPGPGPGSGPQPRQSGGGIPFVPIVVGLVVLGVVVYGGRKLLGMRG